MSHPMWVRGLKLRQLGEIQALSKSHPMWVRGLKLCLLGQLLAILVSHPMWVRGLKLLVYNLSVYLGGVASYVGAWIETNHTSQPDKQRSVASYVGAWIETCI